MTYMGCILSLDSLFRFAKVMVPLYSNNATRSVQRGSECLYIKLHMQFSILATIWQNQANNNYATKDTDQLQSLYRIFSFIVCSNSS